MPGAPSAPTDVLRRGAEALGWQNSEIPRWMKYRDNDPDAGTATEHDPHVPPPCGRRGARLVTGCRIDALQMTAGHARRATTTLTDGRRGTITFRHVFVCGGAIQSPALLQRSRIAGRIGRSLAVHPTVKLAARFADELNVPDDVPVHQVKEFAPDLSFGGSASQPGLVALALSDQWRTFSKAITDWRSISVYYAAITSEGRGRVRAVRGLRDPIVTYGLTRRDRALLGSGLARLALLMLEAGARRGLPVVPRCSHRAQPRRSGDDARSLLGGQSQRHDRSPVLDGADGRRHGQVRRRIRSDECTARPTCGSTMPRCCRAHRVSTHRARSWRWQSAMPADSQRRNDPVVDRFAAPEVTVVTGASGWLGRALLHRLLADRSRRRVRLLARTTAEAHVLEALGSVEVVVGDIAKPDTIARLLHGIRT